MTINQCSALHQHLAAKRMLLASLRVQTLAVLTESVACVPRSPFVLGDFISRAAFVVVVIPPFINRLFDLIDGIEWQDGHLVFS